MAETSTAAKRYKTWIHLMDYVMRTSYGNLLAWTAPRDNERIEFRYTPSDYKYYDLYLRLGDQLFKCTDCSPLQARTNQLLTEDGQLFAVYPASESYILFSCCDIVACRVDGSPLAKRPHDATQLLRSFHDRCDVVVYLDNQHTLTLANTYINQSIKRTGPLADRRVIQITGVWLEFEGLVRNFKS